MEFPSGPHQFTRYLHTKMFHFNECHSNENPAQKTYNGHKEIGKKKYTLGNLSFMCDRTDREKSEDFQRLVKLYLWKTTRMCVHGNGVSWKTSREQISEIETHPPNEPQPKHRIPHSYSERAWLPARYTSRSHYVAVRRNRKLISRFGVINWRAFPIWLKQKRRLQSKNAMFEHQSAGT